MGIAWDRDYHGIRQNATMRVRASTSTAVLLLALFAVTLNRAGAYPIIAEIDEDDETVSRENV